MFKKISLIYFIEKGVIKMKKIFKKTAASLLALTMMTGSAFTGFDFNCSDRAVKAESSTVNNVFSAQIGEVEYTYRVNGNEASILNCTARLPQGKYIPDIEMSEVEIPDQIDGYNVTEICSKVFYGFIFNRTYSIDTLKIGSNVTKISSDAFSSVCVKKIEVSEENENYLSENGVLFDKNKETLFRYPKLSEADSYDIPDTVVTICDYAFNDCSSLQNISIPESVEEIGESAFYFCTALESVTIPSKVKVLKNYVFERCDSLSEADLPEGLETIENNAFAYDSKLKKVYIPDSVKYVDPDAFRSCDGLTDVSVSPFLHFVPDLENTPGAHYVFRENEDVVIVDNAVFSKDMTVLLNYNIYDKWTLKYVTDSYTVPSTVKEIAENAFCNAEIGQVILPEGLEKIGDHAFSNCKYLDTVVFNSSTPELGIGVFSGCKSFSFFVLPDGISVIPEETFNDCSYIFSARIPDGVAEIKKDSMPSSLDQVYIPSSVTKIDDEAFDTEKLSVICGEEGSYAEKFAEDNNISFLKDSQTPNGDVDDDGCTNILDLIKLKQYLLDKDGTAPVNADLNKDGSVSVLDLVKLLDILHGNTEKYGYKNIKYLRERINRKLYTDDEDIEITHSAIIASTSADVRKVFRNLADEELISKYTEKYSEYLDDYVIIFDDRSSVIDIQLYPLEEDTISCCQIDLFSTIHRDSEVLNVILIPRSLYNGQTVSECYLGANIIVN